MRFKERLKVIDDYEKWLKEENYKLEQSKASFRIDNSYLVFLAFLDKEGYLKESNNEKEN